VGVELPLIFIGNNMWRVPEGGVTVSGTPVPENFESDLDTVPRLPIIHAWFKGRTVAGALLHDFLYHSAIEKYKADKLFLVAMKDEGVRARYRYPIYYAVKCFGHRRYKKSLNKNRVL